MGTKIDDRAKDIPEIIIDPIKKTRYRRGRFYGKGGFAKCFELTDIETNKTYAGKIVPKSLLVKNHQKEKMSQEIDIHRSLKHKHVVGFYGFFEDDKHVYIILELCRRRSLMEIHKRRRALTEPEARYFMHQLILAVKYLHDNKIIHRDLKLGNLFINDDMELKVGDFGLATRVGYKGERKRTLCGTPNYIAPEVLSKKGHSFEVDVWSMGCILYTLLVGKPPFETQTLKDTYSKIKKVEYTVPSRIMKPATDVINKMLQFDPLSRPTIDQILVDDFMIQGYLPPRLPVSCLTMAPRFDTLEKCHMSARKPFALINAPASGEPAKSEDKLKKPKPKPVQTATDEGGSNYLQELYQQLGGVVTMKPPDFPQRNEEESEDPAAAPVFWIGKWVDYADKYGFGYQLCDDSIGVVFNDSTKIVLLSDATTVHYMDRTFQEFYHSTKQYPVELEKKMKLLTYFQRYMSEHLVKAGASVAPREGDDLSRLPSLMFWFRTQYAVFMYLTNGTLQVNFFEDHTKVILCPLMSAVTYIDSRKNFRTFRLSKIGSYGCSSELFGRLKYIYSKMSIMVNAHKTKAAHGRLKVQAV